LKDYGNNRVKREVLAFLGTHPNTKFTRYVICRALECSKLEMDEALSDLADARLVENHMNNGLTLYSLTTNKEKRRPVLELLALDRHEWQLIFNRIELKKTPTNHAGLHDKEEK
jgi:hypothetical protein